MKRFIYIFSALLLTFFRISGQTATEIQGTVNKYVKVTSVADQSSVYVSSSTGYAASDTVLIVEMKGAVYSSDNPNVIDDPYNMGKYEFTVINSVAGNLIVFNSPLKNTYDVTQSVQLIRVPSYDSVKVVNELTALTWDGNIGGIIALVSTGTIQLKADINASGVGFRGAAPVTSATGKCFASSSIPFATYNILNFSTDSTSGKKGEGANINSFSYLYGKGPSGNGGGAGTGSYAGGGGGGNYGLGGNGGRESCAGESDYNWGGNGGHIDGQYFDNEQNRIYLGGGGGSGIQKTASSGTTGGNGGGIVILLTPKLITNGYTIKANGADVSTLVSDGSASGGGGGGGMVLMSVDSTISNLKVSVKGGKGGSTTGAYCLGHGGGGGGGFVWYSGQSMTFAQLDLSGGAAGTGVCYVTSTSGTIGDSLNYLQLPLTGFLNNILSASSITCYNTRVNIKGSKPKGGNGTYTYYWEYRLYGSSTWLAAPGKNDSIGYKSSQLTSKTQFRRTVTSNGMNDYSKAITIDVFPEITNNVVNPDTVLCYGSSSITIRGDAAGGGNGTVTYEWTYKTLTGSWILANADVRGNRNYIAGTDETRYYRRKATSDFCSVYDSVKVEVLPVLSNNLITPRQTICSGSIPTAITGTSPLGGTGSTYTYRWQISDDSLTWSNAGITTLNYGTPPALTVTKFYRRIVGSGLNNCCLDTSKNVKIIVLPLLANNSFTAAQTICEATAPQAFAGSTPTGGDNSNGYRYQWETSLNASTWEVINYSADLKNYQADKLDATHYFRRVVFSGLNDCCKSTSSNVKITVQSKITNNSIDGDTTICYNTIPVHIRGLFTSFSGGNGSTYTPKWLQKTSSTDWQTATGDAAQLNYQPGALSESMYYFRQITSGSCIDSSNVLTMNVLQSIQGNEIEGGNKVCDGYEAGTLSSGALAGGETGIYRISWEKSTTGTGNWETLSGETNQTLAPGILPDAMYFRRIVKSGANDCCISTSNVFNISIDKQPSSPVVGSDRDLTYQDTIYIAAQIPAVGTGLWSTSQTAEILNPENENTMVSMPEFGRYVFTWTITNGVCPTVSDSIVAILRDLQRYTGFSPNGDNVNDYFVIDGIDNLAKTSLIVLNKWGVEVYKSEDYKNNWDGKDKHGNDLPEDTYYYVLKAQDVFDLEKFRVYKGFVVLKR